jgi:mRNA-degrading endonuclease RelE of RelBE toxin-antitoxin system
MSYSILPTRRFEKEIKRLNKKYFSLKEEYALLIAKLVKQPDTGVALGNNCYKIRLSIASKGKGKSGGAGGARVITYLYIHSETIYLLTIYDKSEIQSIKDEDIKNMVQELELL